MTIRVRHARKDDIPWLLEQLREFDQFFGAGRSLFPSDPLRAQHFLEALIFQHPFHIAEYVRRVGPPDAFHPGTAVEPVGFIAGALGPHPYNPAIRQLTEMFWWVAPAYRGSRAGSLLLDAFLDEGKQRADWIVMTLEADSPVHDRILEKRGFKPKERSFLLEVVKPIRPVQDWRPDRETVPTDAEGAEV
jgi:GNAT superfamily N-acetyltransferase